MWLAGLAVLLSCWWRAWASWYGRRCSPPVGRVVCRTPSGRESPACRQHSQIARVSHGLWRAATAAATLMPGRAERRCADAAAEQPRRFPVPGDGGGSHLVKRRSGCGWRVTRVTLAKVPRWALDEAGGHLVHTGDRVQRVVAGGEDQPALRARCVGRDMVGGRSALLAKVVVSWHWPRSRSQVVLVEVTLGRESGHSVGTRPGENALVWPARAAGAK